MRAGLALFVRHKSAWKLAPWVSIANSSTKRYALLEGYISSAEVAKASAVKQRWRLRPVGLLCDGPFTVATAGAAADFVGSGPIPTLVRANSHARWNWHGAATQWAGRIFRSPSSPRTLSGDRAIV